MSDLRGLLHQAGEEPLDLVPLAQGLVVAQGLRVQGCRGKKRYRLRRIFIMEGKQGRREEIELPGDVLIGPLATNDGTAVCIFDWSERKASAACTQLIYPRS